MRKSERIVIWLLLACAAGLPIVVGCTDTKQRKAGRKVLDEVDIARRRYDRALALLANPVFKARGEFPPLPTGEPGQTLIPYEKKDIEIVPAMVNPKALRALAEAETGLGKALADNPLAPTAEKALAHLILARIKALEGYYFVAKANLARGRALAALAQAEPTTTQVKMHVALMDYHRTLVGLSDQDIKKQIADAEKDLKEWGAELEQVNKKLVAIKVEKQRLVRENKKRMEDARKLRAESRITSGQKGLDLLNKALAIEEETNRAYSRIDTVEANTISYNVQRADLTVRVDSANQRVTVAKGILQARKESTGQDRDELDKIARSLATILKKLEKLTGVIGENCEIAAKAEELAGEAYKRSQQHLEDSRAFPPSKRHEAMAEEADVLMSAGRQGLARLELHARAGRLVEQIKKLWPQAVPNGKAPQIIKKIVGYVDKPDEVKTEAEKDFRKAADMYRRAGSAMRRALRWVYKGQEASAYIMARNHKLAPWQFIPTIPQRATAIDEWLVEAQQKQDAA